MPSPKAYVSPLCFPRFPDQAAVFLLDGVSQQTSTSNAKNYGILRPVGWWLKNGDQSAWRIIPVRIRG